ncbi:MAG TPA: hypothetical protein VG347_03400 [Verrucomicrobiae bacterium]|nr:hypothetical protein [Verrucomicrobiae bacterium]
MKTAGKREFSGRAKAALKRPPSKRFARYGHGFEIYDATKCLLRRQVLSQRDSTHLVRRFLHHPFSLYPPKKQKRADIAIGAF